MPEGSVAFAAGCETELRRARTNEPESTRSDVPNVEWSSLRYAADAYNRAQRSWVGSKPALTHEAFRARGLMDLGLQRS